MESRHKNHDRQRDHHKSHCRHHNKYPLKSSQKTHPVKFQIQTGFSDAPSNPALLNPPPPQVLFPETLPTPFTPAPSNQKATNTNLTTKIKLIWNSKK